MTRPRARSVADAGLLLSALVLMMLQAQRSLVGLELTGGWWALPITIALGFLCADFGTGALHWFGDRFFHETTPLLGEALIRPFREHHVDPQAMVRHGFLELHGSSAIPVVAVLAGVQGFGPAHPSLLSSAFDAWLFVLCAMSMATNQFHMWAHAPSVPPIVRWLQDKGVILSPARHAVHHRGGFDRSFCMTSGLLNPVLDRVDFFGRLERGVRALGSASR